MRTTEQAQMISGLASLGMIPLGSKSAREGPNPKRLVIATSKEAVELVTQVRPQSQMAESYRALRTSLLLSNLGSPPKVIMVTSALPQEGKTTTSINTAVVLAQKGVRVLLIDADLRRPSIHKNAGHGPAQRTEQRVDRQHNAGAGHHSHRDSSQSCLSSPPELRRPIPPNCWLRPTCEMC